MSDSKFQIFTPAERESLRRAGDILRGTLQLAASLVVPEITTGEIDRKAEEYIRAQGGRPAFKGYHGFPASLCISVNEEIVHGIPGPRRLMDGDIVSLDGGVIFDDLYTDACVTVAVGNAKPDITQFLQTTADVLEDVCGQIVKPGARVGDISGFIQESLERAGYNPVRSLTGHGLGSGLHQFPDIPNIGKRGTGPMIPPWTLLAIEPIASMGKPEVITDDDGWTIRTKDGSLSCHFEHTVLVTENGAEVIA